MNDQSPSHQTPVIAPSHITQPHRFDQILNALDIGGIARKIGLLVEVDARREMDQRVGCRVLHGLFETIGLQEVADNIGCGSRNLVESHDGTPLSAQPPHQCLADEAGASGHENFHADVAVTVEGAVA